MIKIFTKLYPYRLNLKSKEPVDLEIKLKNLSNSAKQISIELIPDSDLSFEKTGSKRNEYKRLGVIKSHESITLNYSVYPFTGIVPGKHFIKIIVGEHTADYNVVNDSYESIVLLNTV